MVHTHSFSSLGSSIELLHLPDNHEEPSLPSDLLIPASGEITLLNGTLLRYTVYHLREENQGAEVYSKGTAAKCSRTT